MNTCGANKLTCSRWQQSNYLCTDSIQFTDQCASTRVL